MLTHRLSFSTNGSRALQALPLVLAAAVLAAMPATLLPVRPIPLDIPSTIGVGAAPEYSVAPISRSVAPAATTVLPSESQPPATSSPEAELGSGGAAPGAQRILAETKGASEVWADRLPRTAAAGEASGNLKLHTRQPTAISTFVASIMKSLSRLRPTATLSAKALAQRMAALKPLPKHSTELLLPTRAPPPKPNLAGWAIGGTAPQRNILGGPASLAARYEPFVSGANVPHYR
jgi:hypothetical protein